VFAGCVGFDLDMTLIDSRPAILAAFGALSRETGVTVDLDDIDRRLGLKLENELAFWFPPTEIDAAAVVFRRYYVNLAATSTPVMPGAHEALAAVRRARKSSVVITAKHQVSVAPCLAASGLRVDHVVAFVHGAEKAEVLVELDAAIYIGDTPTDMAAANKAEVTAVGVATGSFDVDALKAAGATAVLGSLVEFPAWFAEWRGRSRGQRPTWSTPQPSS
jgi:phosphoglycolate phosphatase